jgi:hypothetical protein
LAAEDKIAMSLKQKSIISLDQVVNVIHLFKNRQIPNLDDCSERFLTQAVVAGARFAKPSVL